LESDRVALGFPFSAIVGQVEMKLALQIGAVDPTVGGVLILGHRGTGKSTAVRALAGILPPIRVVAGCAYNCEPGRESPTCPDCSTRDDDSAMNSEEIPVPVVDLPLGATEDRVVGTLSLERALTRGERVFEPGLLAAANRGFLYVDEVNLLEDHLVDLLLDVAASRECIVEREGVSVRHPAAFVLVGSGNPEEGDLRPQLLDRFGLSVEVTTPTDPDERVEVIMRRDAFDRDPRAFVKRWRSADGRVRRKIERAREALSETDVPDAVLHVAADVCSSLGTDGLRGELTLMRGARAVAALQGEPTVGVEHLRVVAPAALRHRLRRDPLDDTGSTARVERVLEDVLGPR
jgi:magnesium chelatase subunit I